MFELFFVVFGLLVVVGLTGIGKMLTTLACIHGRDQPIKWNFTNEVWLFSILSGVELYLYVYNFGGL